MKRLFRNLRQQYLWRRYIKPCLEVDLLKTHSWHSIVMLKECFLQHVTAYSMNVLEVNSNFVTVIVYRIDGGEFDENNFEIKEVTVIKLQRPTKKHKTLLERRINSFYKKYKKKNIKVVDIYTEEFQKETVNKYKDEEI
jgi:hypothetical protein